MKKLNCHRKILLEQFITSWTLLCCLYCLPMMAVDSEFLLADNNIEESKCKNHLESIITLNCQCEGNVSNTASDNNVSHVYKKTVPTLNGPFVLKGIDGKLKYKPYTKDGDRILDFSYCGFMSSEEPIPQVKIVKTLYPPVSKPEINDKFAYPFGQDSSEKIQKDLDEIGSMKPDENGFRGTLLLKKGIWYVNKTLVIQSGVVLRGEGDDEDGTTLIINNPDKIGIKVGKDKSSTFKITIQGKLSFEKINNQNSSYCLTLKNNKIIQIKKTKSRKINLKEYLNNIISIDFEAYTVILDKITRTYLIDYAPLSIRKITDGQQLKSLPGELILDYANPKNDLPAKPLKLIDSYVPAGSTKLNVASTELFQVGDYIKITKTVNNQWIKDLGMDRLNQIIDNKRVKNWNIRSYQMPHVRRIISIKSNTITFDMMLPQSITDKHGGGIIQKWTPSLVDSKCGVEFLRIVSNYDKTIDKKNRSDVFQNLKTGIELNCFNGWVRDCTVLHTNWAAFNFTDRTRNCTVRNCKLLQPVGPVLGGKRYTFNINGGTANLVYKCYSEDARHAYVLGSRVMGPNAFVDCTAVRSTNSSEPHHRWGTGTLFDNISLIDGGALAALNRGASGSGHGWSAANTVFWNCNAPSIVVFDPETAENNFAIGYRGKTSNKYSTRFLRYGNDWSNYKNTPFEGRYIGFALMGTGYIESPENPVEPGSLFKQQLIDRIGKEKAMRVLE